jgi:hypothetical protein
MDNKWINGIGTILDECAENMESICESIPKPGKQNHLLDSDL